MISGEIPSFDLFQALLQQSTDLVSVLNADGILQYASPAYALTLGYEATDVIGTSAFSRIHPGDLDRVRAAFGATRSSPGIPIKLEFRYRHADGAWRTLQTTATNQLDNPVVRGIVINARDITERVHAEEQYRNVFDATSDGLFITALDGIVVDANPAACHMHGYTRSQMIGRPLSQLMDLDL